MSGASDQTPVGDTLFGFPTGTACNGDCASEPQAITRRGQIRSDRAIAQTIPQPIHVMLG